MSNQNNPQRDASTPRSHHLARDHVRIALVGARGRMGTRIDALARDHPRARVTLRIVSAPHAPSLDREFTTATDALASLERDRAASSDLAHRPLDAIIDFSAKNGVFEAIRLADALSCALLVGTTGLDDTIVQSLRALSSRVPVLVCSNTSLGVAAVAHAAGALARALGPSYRASIVETHHAMKKDAPSGTALRLASALRAAGSNLRDEEILSIRAGDIVGEHTIRLTGDGETIELTHRATTRDLFAHGALRLAVWLAAQPPGWYRVEDSIIPQAPPSSPLGPTPLPHSSL